MNDKIDDGGDAFPVPCASPFGDGRLAYGGLSKREYFAAMAMQAMIGSEVWHDIDRSRPSQIADDAYDYADAMIAQGKKSK